MTQCVWADGREEKIDVVIFCTGFKPALNHLKSLDVVNQDGKADTDGTRSKKVNGLWLVGYGNWTGFASATLIGVGRRLRQPWKRLFKYLSTSKEHCKCMSVIYKQFRATTGT